MSWWKGISVGTFALAFAHGAQGAEPLEGKASAPAWAETTSVKRRGARVTGHVRLAAALNGIFDTPLYGVEVEGALGVRWLERRFQLLQAVSYERAETDWGLDTHRAAAGVALGWKHGPAMVGVHPAFSVLVVERHTRDKALIGVGFGADAIATVDLLRDEEENALFLALRAGTHFIPQAWRYGGSLGLGVRFGTCAAGECTQLDRNEGEQ